jgi:molybdenum ABC transporter molybdate-binding protein
MHRSADTRERDDAWLPDDDRQRENAMHRLVLLVGFWFVTSSTMASAETLRLYAAGSLRAALTEVARAFEAKHAGSKVELEFAASGLLRERIEAGEAAHVFASADVGHPAKLAQSGRALADAVVFARNQLCALARAGLRVTSATLLETMLDPGIRLGTSTPKADPSGDYAFALFAKAESRKAGARSVLESKALQLTGGPASAKAPAGKNQYGWVMSSGQADVFLTYCTNAVLAQKDVPALQIVQIPTDLNVAADYGMVVLKGAPASASLLAAFIRGEDGQSILAGYGFGRGDPP